MLKKCGRCKLQLPLEDFYNSGDRPSGYCRVCTRAYSSEWWKRTKRAEMLRKRRNRDTKYKDYMRGLMKARYAKNKAVIDDWKVSHGCSVCGEKRAPCLDLHHKSKGSKRHNKDVLSATGKYWGRKRTMKALESADVLCSNCHRWLHHQERLAGISVSRVKRQLTLDSRP